MGSYFYTLMKRPIIPYNPKLKKLARRLRNNSTKSEAFLWNYLKGKQIHGFDFHRQRPVDNFIIDFFCQELYLAIELDGYSHLLESSEHSDYRKEQKLDELGIKLIRFWDEEIFNDLDNVLRVIEITVIERKEFLGI
jgi:very-short-patch-repair endonuclease